MVIVGKKASKIEVGDVIVFSAGKNYPIIHRVVDIKKDANGKIFFETKGDNNPAQIVSKDPITNEILDEHNVSSDKVQGVAKIRVPYLGYIKIVATAMVVSSIKFFASIMAWIKQTI
jgi:signal peptidase I